MFWRLGSRRSAAAEDVVFLEPVASGDVLNAFLDGIVKAEADARPGVVVLPKVGGTTHTTAAKEAAAEFKSIAGIRLPLIPVPNLPTTRRTLVREFPHVADVIDRMLADLSGRETVKFAPTLLVGPAGCGKSRFARRIGEACGLYVASVDGASASDAAFGGTSRRWSSGEPSKPLAVVKDCRQASALILVDEIDKAGTSRHNGNLVNALLPMLEVETARRYPDIYTDVAVDLSHLSFVLTANDDVGLPRPLLDRCRILRMPPITADHVPALAGAIVADLAAERGVDPRWVPGLDGDELEIAQRLLGDGSIRRLRSIIERLLAARETRAARN